MKLFEIITGETGCSYVRAYCWAADEKQARKLFREKNPGREARVLTLLFEASAKPFCTIVDSEGWDGDR